MPSLSYANSILIPSLYQGGLFILPTTQASEELCNYATSVVQDVFETLIDEVEITKETNLQLFIDKTKKCKSIFTNADRTQELLKSLISERYRLYPQHRFLYDVPRIRIVPPSNFLSSGVSYNYKPHRDTWYGGGQDQINHWMSLSNVTEESTFYIAPTYFTRPIENNSETFNLDEWDSKYRPLAEQNTSTEVRPHPIPLAELPNEDRYSIVMPRGSEIVFSGHHLHGSGLNTTSKVRFSIDYRVCPETPAYSLPENIDNRASGDYRKYMFAV